MATPIDPRTGLPIQMGPVNPMAPPVGGVGPVPSQVPQVGPAQTTLQVPPPAPSTPAQPQRANPYASMPRMNPNRAMWTGIINDMANYIGSAGASGFQGLGNQYRQQALANNMRRTQLSEEWERQQRAETREQERYERDRLLTGNEQDYQNWLQAAGTEDSMEARAIYAEWKKRTGGSQASLPSSLQEWEAYNAMSPEDQKRFLEMKRGPEMTPELAAAIAAGRASGGMQPGEQRALNVALAGIQTTLASYDTLEDMVEQLPGTGPITGEAFAVFSGQYQALRAQLFSNALRNIGTLAEQGIRLNPITENELRLLLATQPQLANTREGNLRIIADERRKLRRLERQIESQLAHIRAGNPIETWTVPDDLRVFPEEDERAPKTADDYLRDANG